MIIRIEKIGNSLGFRLPESVLKELKVSEGDSFDVSVKNGEIVLKKNSYYEFSIRKAAKNYYGMEFAKCRHIDDSGEYAWPEAIGEEVW